MKPFTAILLCLFSLAAVAQKQEHIYSDTLMKCVYETSRGKLHGKYISYYSNGKKKAAGTFENNYRTGKWTVWDEYGRMRMQRVYSDPFTFKRTVPEVSKDKLVQLLNVPQYNLQYNKQGFLEYFKLYERAVVWARRIGRFISPAENSILFEQNKLFSILNTLVGNKNVQPYNVSIKINQEALLTKGIDTSNFKLIGYKIDEDCFFDNERLVSETRIIAICPVVINIIKQDTIDMYWVPFSEIRPYLAKEPVTGTIPAKIKTLDDLFFYRNFYGQILKASYQLNNMLPTYNLRVGAEKESEKIEMELIEKEHDIWISFTE